MALLLNRSCSSGVRRRCGVQYPPAVALASVGGLDVSDGLLFKDAFPYQQDVFALPVVDVDAAERWYINAFGLQVVERRDQPHRAVILERDGVRIGFALTGGDASQDGAGIQVSD